MSAPQTPSDELDTPAMIHANEILRTYASLMEEIKRRLNVINIVWASKDVLDLRTAEEFCLLHLRMICELIAIGCLVVHDDIKETRGGKIRGLYQADMITRALSTLHGDFYPRPGKQQVYPDGRIEVTPITSGFLTRSELAQLYRKCGEVLHIGSLKNWPTNWNRSIDMPAIHEWYGKIVTLLNHHQITLVRKGFEIWTLMNDSKDGRVQSTLFRKIGPVQET